MNLQRALIAALVLIFGTSLSLAQSFPVKPIRIIVPVGPGGGLDAVARLIGVKLAEAFGQPIVIDNRPGAGGTIGMDLVARATPDGHTLAVFSSSQVINAVLSKTPYDLLRGFFPISQTAAAPYVLVVHPAVPAKSVAELVSYAKANPGRLNYASVGEGTLQHLATELFAVTSNIKLVHVPYKGLGAAFPDLISNRVQMTMSSITALLPHIRSKALHPLAVTSAQRTMDMPELPTMMEAGVAGFVVTQWHGMLAPAGTPRPVIERLQREIANALQQPDVATRLARDSTVPVGSSPAEFSIFLKGENGRWRRVIKQVGLRAE
jgi:tripartite-type tricarboxylate transporter receptor subunit TctC